MKKIIAFLLIMLVGFNMLPLYSSASTQNLALNAPVTVSSEYSTYLKSNATDGDLDTSWYASPTAEQASISVDLGAVIPVNQIKIYWGIYDYTTDFEIQVSDSVLPNDEAWTTIEPISTTITQTQAHYITTIDISQTEQRHIKIMCREKINWSYEIFEFQVYNLENIGPITPANLSVTFKSSEEIDLTWDSIEITDATYQLYRETNGVDNSKILIYSGSATNYTDCSITPGQTYKYSILSKIDNEFSNESEPIVVTADNSAAPSAVCNLTTSIVSKTYVKMNWINSFGATEYRIYRDGIKIASTQNNRFTDYGLFENREYTYTIYAVNGTNTAPGSSLIITTMAGTATHITVKTVTFNSISFSWQMPAASALKIFRNDLLVSTIPITNSANLSNEQSVTGKFTDTNLDIDTQYEYTFVAVNSSGELSTYSSSITAATAPNSSLGSNINANIANRSNEFITVLWNPVNNATVYQVFRYTNNVNSAEMIYSGNSISYTDSNVTHGIEYNYFVKALDSNSFVISPVCSAVASVPHSNNTAYLPTEWFSLSYYENKNMSSFIRTRLSEMHDASIKYAFCDIGRWECIEGTIIEESYDYSALGYWMMEADAYNVDIIACFNCASDDTITTSLTEQINQRLNNYCVELYQNGININDVLYKIDGVQLDFEPYSTPAHRNFLLSAATSLRNSFGNDLFISVATPSKNGRYTDAEMTSLINVVDMINPMIYDSNEPYYEGTVTTEEEIATGVTRNKNEYINLVKNSCLWYSALIEQSTNSDCILSPTIPVYEDKNGANNPNGGFPDPSEPSYLYHCNYNYILEESLENAENALIGVNLAIESGASISSCGIFYWAYIVGLHQQKYGPLKSSYYNPAKDMNDWMTEWVTKNN